MKSRPENRGAVLIVVLGVLTVLALLATTFASLQGVERSVSRNYLDGVRAALLAQSGVEFAVAELRKEAERTLEPRSGPQPWRYWGGDTQENGAGNPALRLEDALNPSFAVEDEATQDPYDANVTPRRVRMEGVDRGFSGGMTAGAYGKNADLYSLKVTDASAKIFINEGVKHHLGNASAGSRNLRRILNQLGAVATVNLPGLGDLVVDNRPPQGYQSVRELRKYLTDSQYASIEDLLTAHAWVDRTVANPVAVSAAHAASSPVAYWRGAASVYRFGRGKDYLNQSFSSTAVLQPYQELQVFPSTSPAGFLPNSLSHAVYALDELNPQWIETTSRAPVNVNTARREVLIALLSDLRGVFLSERRRNNIATGPVGLYHYLMVKHTYSQEKMPTPPHYNYPSVYNLPEGDELGFLYETWPIVGPAGTGSGVSAADVAEHLLACREGRATSGVSPSFDYSSSSVPFRGPFRNWRQFHVFADHLVTIGVLEDPRGKAGGPAAVFFDHEPVPPAGGAWNGNITGNFALVPSEPQRKAASQAMADVLKANFNPNLHLNELNPDRNLFLHVDKTDLVVHSTEFIFTPTGTFEVESLGRVLDPGTGGDALDPAVNNRIVAEAKVRAGVKLFELVRETDQNQFSAGTASALAAGGLTTNNGLSLEIGPEPDNGSGPQENRWSGYVALPTTGGNGGVKGSGGAPVATPDGTGSPCGMSSTLHSHLAWDFDAHVHADGDDKRRDMGSGDLDAADKLYNFADPGETVPGPYDPTDNGGNYYRLARSFSLPETGAGSVSLPVLTPRAPLDLRVDGGYIERHAGLAYWISPTSYVPNTAQKRGAMSYWIKPSFFPERSGKPRLYMDMSRRSRGPIAGLSHKEFLNAGFVHVWNAGHDVPPGSSSSVEYQSTWGEASGSWKVSTYWGPMPMKPQSMVFGTGYGNYTGHSGWNGSTGPTANYYQYMLTPSVNHREHGHAATVSLFQGHEWIHIALSWIKVPTSTDIHNPLSPNMSSWEPATYRVFVNGALMPGYLEVVFRQGVAGGESDSLVDHTTHYNGTTHHFGNPNGGDRNALRFGSPSVVWTGSLAATAVPPATTGDDFCNFTADSTMDEIYFWNDNAHESTAISHWVNGRYAFPKTSSEGLFTSAEVPLIPEEERSLAPVSPEAPPVISGGWAGPGSGGISTASTPQTRILGMSWTWMAEGVETVGGESIPTLVDHSSTGVTLHPEVQMQLVDASNPTVALTPYVTKDGYSPALAPTGGGVILPQGSSVRYRLKFLVPGADPINTILLASPVVDDVTLYYTCGDAVFTYYYNDMCRL